MPRDSYLLVTNSGIVSYITLDERGFSALKGACPRQDCVRGCFQETKTGGLSFRLKADGV